MTTHRLRVTPGYARRWWRRNWHRAIWCGGWTAAGYGIMHAVQSSRLNPDAVGGEALAFAVCLALALAGAVRER